MITPDTTVYPSPKTAYRVIDGEAIILTPLDGRILTLNDTGSRIWELIANKSTVRDVANTICSEFETSVEQSLDDTLSFLGKLAERSMIEIQSPE